MSGDYVDRLRAALDGRQRVRHALGEPHPDMVLVDMPDLRAALDELGQLRAVRTCGSAAVLFNGDEHVCVLPFGHGPEHRDRNGTRWQVYDALPASDDALKAMVRMQGLTLPALQQPEDGRERQVSPEEKS